MWNFAFAASPAGASILLVSLGGWLGMRRECEGSCRIGCLPCALLGVGIRHFGACDEEQQWRWPGKTKGVPKLRLLAVPFRFFCSAFLPTFGGRLPPRHLVLSEQILVLLDLPRHGGLHLSVYPSLKSPDLHNEETREAFRVGEEGGGDTSGAYTLPGLGRLRHDVQRPNPRPAPGGHDSCGADLAGMQCAGPSRFHIYRASSFLVKTIGPRRIVHVVGYLRLAA
ncbi:hypothetical protein VUR80DRAFT_6581 [Thermomyces stellatus]